MDSGQGTVDSYGEKTLCVFFLFYETVWESVGRWAMNRRFYIVVHLCLHMAGSDNKKPGDPLVDGRLVVHLCLHMAGSDNKKSGMKQDHTPISRIYCYTRPLPILLSPGVLTAHYPYHLMLLGSPPDMVHEG